MSLNVLRDKITLYLWRIFRIDKRHLRSKQQQQQQHNENYLPDKLYTFAPPSLYEEKTPKHNLK
jgi:hypothetical protein